MMNCLTTHRRDHHDFLRFAILPFRDPHLVQVEDLVPNKAM
jgi:hypothetical protein